MQLRFWEIARGLVPDNAHQRVVQIQYKRKSLVLEHMCDLIRDEFLDISGL